MTAPLFHHPQQTRGGCPTPCEKLLMNGLAAWAAARREGLQPHSRVAAVLMRQTSGRVAALFMAWVQAVEAATLRPLETECPCCGGISIDVQRLVVACGLAPVDLALGERLIAPMVSEPQSVMVLARSLNAALASAGWPLPARLPDIPVAANDPRPRHTLH